MALNRVKAKFPNQPFWLGLIISLPLFSNFGGISPRPLPVGFFACFFLGVFFLLTSLVAGRVRFFDRGLLIFIALFAFSFIIGISSSPDLVSTIAYVGQLLLPVFGYIAVRLVANSCRKLEDLILGLLSGCVLASFLVLQTYSGGLVFEQGQLTEPMIGPFVWYQFYQYGSLVLLGYASLGVVVWDRGRVAKCLILTNSLLTISVVFYNVSTAGKILALPYLLLFFMAVFRVNRRPLLLATLIFVPLVTLFIWIFMRADFKRFSNLGNRLDVWSESISALGPYGWGGRYFYSSSIDAHNQILDLWLRSGIPIAAFFAIGLLALVTRMIHFVLVSDSIRDFYQGLGLLFGFFCVALAGSVIAVPFQQPYSGLAIWVLIGVFIVLANGRVMNSGRSSSYSYSRKLGSF